MNRMSRCAALMGTLLSLSVFAQECKVVSLYENGGEMGKMEDGKGTFPENPEWNANWGTLGEMKPPYIRLSGQKDNPSDWNGEFSFGKMPLKVSGGNLKMKLRSTRKGDARVWLTGDFGKSSSYAVTLEKDRTYSLEIPVSELAGDGVKNISRVGVGLVGVPAYQYTTLFVDDIFLTCGVSESDANSSVWSASGGNRSLPAELLEQSYSYSDVPPGTALREGKFMKSPTPETTPADGEDERRKLKESSGFDFVVSPLEYVQLKEFAVASELEPDKSRDGWFRCLYLVERNRLRDNVIANPKALFYEAKTFAAGNDHKAMPLLLANVDYGASLCADSLCSQTKVVPERLLLAGLPAASLRGSVLKLYYDSYFLTTNRKNFPGVEIYVDGVWQKMMPRTELELRFKSAGVQKIKVRLSEGGLTLEQNLFVEVK